MKHSNYIFFALIAVLMITVPELGFCGVESSLENMKDALISKFIPLCGILGLCWASFSFFAGNPNAKNHMFLAIFGSCVGFGAPAIVDLVSRLVN